MFFFLSFDMIVTFRYAFSRKVPLITDILRIKEICEIDAHVSFIPKSISDLLR